jgi:molybdopterin-containing oxidoreductase family iron-sulfur binding subunit
MSKSTDQPDINRRQFVGVTAGALAAATVAPGVVLHSMAQARPAGEPASDKVRWGMLIDTAKCADGCTACVEACDQENGLNLLEKPDGEAAAKWDEQRPQWIRKVKLRDRQTGNVTSMPFMCQHCEHPPCVDVCPTGASFKRADGLVLVNRHTCIGCRYCMMACPYKARSFIHENVHEQLTEVPRGKGCVESCTFCIQKLDRGEATTACTEACDRAGHKAIVFGDLKDPNSELSRQLKQYPSRQVRADLELNTGVRYRNL